MLKPFVPQVVERTWGEEALIAWHVPADGGGGFTGKVLRRYAGEGYCRAGLQYHERKDETFHLLEGKVWVYHVADGCLRRTRMTPGMSFRVPPGTIHSVETITDSVMFEVSNDVFDDRVRVEEQYAEQMAALGAAPAAPVVDVRSEAARFGDSWVERLPGVHRLEPFVLEGDYDVAEPSSREGEEA